MQTFEVGKAPWEIGEVDSSPEPKVANENMQTFEVGKAPWEVEQTQAIETQTTVSSSVKPTITVQDNYSQVPDISTYTNNTSVGKNDSWLDDIINTGKDIAEELYNPIKPAVESTALTLGRISSGIGEAIESPISAISTAIGGRKIDYYANLNKRLDEAQKAKDEEITKSLGGGVLDSSTLAEIGLGFAYGNSLKAVTVLEGITQAAIAEPGKKLQAGAIASGTVLAGGKAMEAIVNRYVGTDRTLRKLFKTLGMDADTAKSHYAAYSRVTGKAVSKFTVSDKVNAIVHGSPEAESVLFESVASNPANSKMLNEYYKKVSNQLSNMLDNMPYEESIALGRNIKTQISEGYNNITQTLDATNINVQVSDNIKTAIDAFSKNALSKLDSEGASDFSSRVSNLMDGSGTIGDLFEVEKIIRSNINKVDKLGADVSLNQAKAVLKNEMQGLLLKTLKDNKLDNIIQSRELMNKLYTELSNANKKKLIKVLQDPNIKKKDYTKIYEAMKSTEEASSYNSLINLVGRNSKAAGNIEEFVLDRLMNKRMDDLDVINLGKLLGDLEDVTFKSRDGKLMNQIIQDFNKAFGNMKSSEAWALERMDAGGSKSDFVNQIKASAIGRAAYKIAQYLPLDSSRRVYVINHLPKYLKDGIVPKNMKPEERRALEVYKTVVGQSNRLLAEELNNLAEKSKQEAQYLQSVQPEQPLLPGGSDTMTATAKGNVATGTGTQASLEAQSADLVGTQRTGQAVNSYTNELQAPRREVVTGTVEEATPEVKQTEDIIDVETTPSYIKGSDNRIFDSQGNQYESVDDLVRAMESTKIPYKTKNKDLFKEYDAEFSKIVQNLLKDSNKSADSVIKTIDKFIPTERRIQNIMNSYQKEIQSATQTMDRARAFQTVKKITETEARTLIKNIEKDLGVKLPESEANKIIMYKLKELMNGCK